MKVIENGKVVQRLQTHSKRRFYNKIRTIKWKNNHVSVYLRINYGKHLSNRGKLESFWNDGEYDNREDLMLAVNAFLEDYGGKFN